MTPRKIAAFALGPTGGALLGVVTLPIIAWFFSQEDVGRSAILQVAVGFSTLLFSLGLDQAYVREFHEVDNKPGLLKLALLPGLSMLIMSLLVLLSFGGTLAGWLFERPQWHLSLLIALVLLSTFISRFLSLVLRMNEQGLLFSISQILSKLVLLVTLLGYIFFGAEPTFTKLVLANAMAFLVVLLVLLFNTRTEWVASVCSPIDRERLGKMLRFGGPLIVGGLGFWGLTASDKLFLRSLAGFDDVGLYSVAMSIAGIGAILQAVFSVVWAPTIYKLASIGDGLEIVHQTSRYMLGLVVLIFSLAGLFSWIVPLFLPENYRDAQWILPACLGATLLYTLSEVTVVGLGINRRSGFAMVAVLMALAINLLGNYLLIPRFGAAGAAISTCIAFWFFFVLRTEFSVYVWRPFPRKTLYIFSGLAATGACIFALFGEGNFLVVQIFWGGLVLLTGFSLRAEVENAVIFFLGHVRK